MQPILARFTICHLVFACGERGQPVFLGALGCLRLGVCRNEVYTMPPSSIQWRQLFLSKQNGKRDKFFESGVIVHRT